MKKIPPCYYLGVVCTSVWRRFVTCGIILLLMLQAVSCRRRQGTAVEHPEYLIPVLDHAWALADSAHIIPAFNYLDSVYNHLPFQPGKYDRYRRYNFKAHHLIGSFHNYKAALEYVDSMLLMLEGEADTYTDDYLSTLVQKGFVCFSLNRYAEAYLYYYKGKMLSIQYGSRCQYASLAASLGRVTYRQGKYRDAISYFAEAFSEGAYCDTANYFPMVHLRQEQISNIGLCYEQLGLTDSAVWYYESALDFIEQHEKSYPEAYRSVAMARGVVYGNLGSVYQKIDKPAEARQYLERAIQINSLPGYDHYDALLNRIKLGDLYLFSGDYENARQVMMQIKSSLDSTWYDEAELRWKKLVWRYHDALGQTEPAYRALLDYSVFKDSFDAARRELPGMDYNTIFDNLSQQYQIGRLQADNRIKEVYLLVVAGFFVMVVIIFFLIRKNYLQSRHNVATLTELNRKVTAQNVYLQQTLDTLEYSQHENTRMIKTVAHDLRNPVAAIVGIADLLLLESENTPGQKEMIGMIRTSGASALQFMEDLLIDNPDDSISPEVIALDELIEYSAALMKFRASEKKQHLSVHLQQAFIRGNRQKIWRVLNNLIVNAIKFTPENKQITIGMELREGKVLIAVRDEGIGIPDEIKDCIFDAVTSARRTGTSGELSFGIGLAITKQIVRAHNGSIWFETETGNGTVFYVELPAVTDPGGQ